MDDEYREDGGGTETPLEESGPVDVLAENKRLARRRIIMGTAAAGAVLGSINRAHAVGVSACFSGLDLPQGLAQQLNIRDFSHGNLQGKAPGLVQHFTDRCGLTN